MEQRLSARLIRDDSTGLYWIETMDRDMDSKPIRSAAAFRWRTAIAYLAHFMGEA